MHLSGLTRKALQDNEKEVAWLYKPFEEKRFEMEEADE